MPDPDDAIWQLDPHTGAKHEILRRYLQAWLPIMTSWNGRVVILDGFAGPGEYVGGEHGSPLIAMEVLLQHQHAPIKVQEVIFLFIEKQHDRADHLRMLLESMEQSGELPPKAKWQVIEGEFDDTMTGVLDNLDKQGLQLAPTFAFLDPFGYSATPMSTISRLIRHPRCEVLINFMYGFINRFLAYDNEANQEHYDKLFGSPVWREVIEMPLPPQDRERRLHDLYQSQLQSAGGARFVRSFRMRNKHNNTEYYLFFGTNNLTGLDKMKQAMWKVDPTGAYDFSDLTDPNQPTLFTPEPDYEYLGTLLRNQFQGKVTTVQTIQDYVIADTAFCSNHYKTKVLKPMEYAGVIEVVSPPTGRKRGTFGDMAMRIRFR